MSRIHADWLSAYMKYAEIGEAPHHMLFWVGVSTIAGALRRKVWSDEDLFRWYPNFYICLVAPPGIVSKTTTCDVGMRLLREVPDVKFGPDIVTWPSLVEKFAESTVQFLHNGLYYPMSAMTMFSGEFGNLLDPQDKQMVDLLVSLWDGKEGNFQKSTKNSGEDEVVNPWINMLACTTPDWIAGSFPQYMIGGGFTSRTVFVYAERKRQIIASPKRNMRALGITAADRERARSSLIIDLTRISELSGEYIMTTAAETWEDSWYDQHNRTRPANLDGERFGGYLARKQTHIRKLAMVLSASQGDDLTITAEHLQTAYGMVTDLEPDLQYVFNKIGRSDSSLNSERLVEHVHGMAKPGEWVTYAAVYRQVHALFPSMRDFEDVLAGCCRAGFILYDPKKAGGPWLSPGAPMERSGK